MRSLSAKLVAGLVAGLTGVLFWLGAANLKVLRDNLETTVVASERKMADVIFRSTRDGMLRNDRHAQAEIIRSIASQPDVKKIRLLSKTGRIEVSSDPAEVGRGVAKSSEPCAVCHSSSQPLTRPAARATFRFYRMGNERVIGLMRPIENEPACANAACHAHPESQRILGVLDVVFSLRAVDEAMAAQEARMRFQLIACAVLMTAMTALAVWVLFSRPLKRLIAGVHELAAHRLSYRFRFRRQDEIGELAGAFDNMAEELENLNATLEERIRKKTKELEAAQEKLIHSEKLASLGQLSAAVAHEINNPLAGIFTYAKLIEKKLNPIRPVLDWVQTIQHESRRCGDIVNNLLVFARRQHTEMAPAEVKVIFQRTVSVVQHKLEMHAIELSTEIEELPPIWCDASQIQQVLTVMIINAVDAITGQGNGKQGHIRMRAAKAAEDRVDLCVANNGPPIPKDVLPKIFEPFFSTKQAASGVGLGLAVAYGIVKRHGGDIQVETGDETAFHILLPLGDAPPAGLEKSDVGEAVHPDR